jgi:mono/diheme cytochrome c family protein
MILRLGSIVAWCALSALSLFADASGLEFFEKKIRPVLVENCYSCHSAEAENIRGQFRLDTRQGLLAGGASGPAIVPGDPGNSLLIRAVRYTDPALQMPPKDRKLSEAEIADLEAWIRMGAPDPRSSESAVEKDNPLPYDLSTATNWWAFRPPTRVAPPQVKNKDWSRSPIDAFLLARLEEQQLSPAPRADKRTLIRRATIDLIGLPPTPEEVEAFLADASPDAFARVVERLLNSPHYGERWGRHWLDVVRYTDSFDSRGIGGEADVPESWRYRDWVVNAFNRDLPYDQFILHQIAGDLLPSPDGLHVEATIATGMYAIGNWGGGDADKEKMLTDIVDDQIDVTSRAFLGMTLSCARCHDHKTDPFTMTDYYGLAGIFFSTHILPEVGPKTAGSPVLRIPLLSKRELEERKNRETRITHLEKQIESDLDLEMQRQSSEMLLRAKEYLEAVLEVRRKEASKELARTIAEQRGLGVHALTSWLELVEEKPLALFKVFARDIHGHPGLHALRHEKGDTPSVTANTTGQELQFITITLPPRTLAVHPSPKGGVAAAWKSPISGNIRLRGSVRDADDKCGDGIEWKLWHRGDGEARELALGAIPNGGSELFSAGAEGGVQVKRGDWIELRVLPKAEYSCDTTVIDLEVRELGGEERVWALTQDVLPEFASAGNPRADHFGNREVWHFHDLNPAGAGLEPPANSSLAQWIRRARTDPADAAFVDLTEAAAKELATGAGPEAWRKFRNEFFGARGSFWRSARTDLSLIPSGAKEKIEATRTELAALKAIPLPPIPMTHGLQEGGCPKTPYEGFHDARVHIRGRYDRLGPVAPRRMPLVLAGEDQKPITNGSGRWELAHWIARPENPLTARVMVNRIWQHHFGEGLVRTPNNFGKLGAPPTHPELLDFLALEFTQSGWSIKAMHRAIMLSAAYQQSSVPDPQTLERDPDNLLFGRMNRRRVESEVLRDCLLAVTGELDRTVGGRAVRDLNIPRRTLYVMTIRSDLSTFQSLFDAADPTGIVEKRVHSTVSPQALFLLNDPFMLMRSEAVAKRALATATHDDAKRIEWLYSLLYSRPPRPQETKTGLQALAHMRASEDGGPGSEERVWEQYCQVLLCANEFVYID